MPILGLGTFKSEPGLVKNIVRMAIEVGYRHFDCAAFYKNEKEVGEAIRDAMKAGDVQREDLWITSKLWNDCHLPQHVRSSVKQSLRDLKVDYLDLYLIHWPVAHKHGVQTPGGAEDLLSLEEAPLEETWEAMEDCVDDELIRHIGLSNSNISVLQSIIDAAWIPPEMNQVEMHPYLPQGTLYDYCRENDILMTAYGPLGAPYRQVDNHGKPFPILLQEPAVTAISEKHGCTPAQVLIAWSISRGVAVIPKTVNEDRLVENFKASEIKLDREDLRSLGIMPKHRYVMGELFTVEGSPYGLKDLFEY